MSTHDEWGQLPLAWERASGAIAVSRERGWEWTARPAGSAELDELVGHSSAGTHDDIVIIEALKDPMEAIGARFAPGDWESMAASRFGVRSRERPTGFCTRCSAGPMRTRNESERAS